MAEEEKVYVSNATNPLKKVMMCSPRYYQFNGINVEKPGRAGRPGGSAEGYSITATVRNTQHTRNRKPTMGAARFTQSP